MEIVKTYDLEKLKEIVLKEIDAGLSSGRDHARINLISVKEIEEILAECMARESINYTFVEKEHPEIVMIEGEIAMKDEQIKCLSERNEKLEKENKELREQNKMFYESITEGVKITKPCCFGHFNEECVNDGKCLYLGECIDEAQNAILKKEEQMKKPSCFGKFDLANIDCLKCKEKEYCLSEKEEQTNA